MLPSDQNENLNGANGATGLSDSVNPNPVPTEKKLDPSSNNQSIPSSDFLHDTLKRKQAESVRLANILKTEKEKSLPDDASRNEIVNTIMERISAPLKGVAINLSEEEIDELGIALITNYCGINVTARQFHMSEAHLRFLINADERLAVYHEIAQDGIKALTDEHLIEGLRKGDPDILRLVATRMYAGRNKGGFNISEIGTMGYQDKLSKKLSQETADDRSKGNVRVTFNFVRRDIHKHSNITRVNEAAIDAEYEDVEDDEKQ